MPVDDHLHPPDAPQPVTHVPATVVRQHVDESGNLHIKIGTTDDDPAAEPPSMRPGAAPVAPPVSQVVAHGVAVDRSDERDSAGNPMRTTIRLGG